LDHDDDDAVIIFADNQSAIKLLRNPIATQRAKHIDIVYHFARERVARGEVAFKYISTHDMVADVLTKPLSEAKLSICCSQMGVAQAS